MQASVMIASPDMWWVIPTNSHGITRLKVIGEAEPCHTSALQSAP
jgi:hypothetical protein